MYNDKTLEHIWTLFQSLEDSNDELVIAACQYFHKEYDFDLNVLPTNLYNKLIEQKAEDSEYESYEPDEGDTYQ